MEVALAQNAGTLRAWRSSPFQPCASATGRSTKTSSTSSTLKADGGCSAQTQAGTLPITGIAWGPLQNDSAPGSRLLLSAGAGGKLQGWSFQGEQVRQSD